jgi:hypothetical protein
LQGNGGGRAQFYSERAALRAITRVFDKTRCDSAPQNATQESEIMRIDLYESVSSPAKKLIVPVGAAVDNAFRIDTTDPDYREIRLVRRDVELRGGKRHLGIDTEKIVNILDQLAVKGYALATAEKPAKPL